MSMVKTMIALLGMALAVTAGAQLKEKTCVLGFCMGDAVDKEPKGTTEGVHYAEAEHDLFYTVTAYWTRKTGICSVKGLYEVPSPDDFGTAHKAAFNRFVDLVKRKRGEPSKTLDFLKSGSIWKEPRYWRMGLRQNERVLASIWTDKDVGKGIDGISVSATDSFIVVTYEFDNFDECMETGAAASAEDF